jgi:hypothetical protein
MNEHNLLFDFLHLIKASKLLADCLEAEIERLLGIKVKTDDGHLEDNDRAPKAKCLVLTKTIVEPAFKSLEDYKYNNRKLGMNIYL